MNMVTFANTLLQRQADYLAQRCASCGAELTLHFADAAITTENPNGFTGCPEYAKQQALVTSIADALVVALAAREGVAGAHLSQLEPDVREQYRTAAAIALAQLGVIDARRI